MKKLIIGLGVIWTTTAVGQQTPLWNAHVRTALLTAPFLERKATDPMNFRNVNELGFTRHINPKNKELPIYVGVTLGQLREQQYLKDVIMKADDFGWPIERGNAEIMRNAFYVGFNAFGVFEIFPKLQSYIGLGLNGLVTNSFTAIVAPENQRYVNEDAMENIENRFFFTSEIGLRYPIGPQLTLGVGLKNHITGNYLALSINEPTSLTDNTIKAFDNSIFMGVSFSLNYQF
jgi:hypothetical protein